MPRARAGLAMRVSAATGFGVKAETSAYEEYRLKAETTEGTVDSAFRRKGQSAEDSRRLMWEHAGLFRTAEGLRAALT